MEPIQTATYLTPSFAAVIKTNLPKAIWIVNFYFLDNMLKLLLFQADPFGGPMQRQGQISLWFIMVCCQITK
jgi:hypothetical protein